MGASFAGVHMHKRTRTRTHTHTHTNVRTGTPTHTSRSTQSRPGLNADDPTTGPGAGGIFCHKCGPPGPVSLQPTPAVDAGASAKPCTTEAQETVKPQNTKGVLRRGHGHGAFHEKKIGTQDPPPP
uniref:Uncharacterized protein n=1 Tax=Eutreptiella gymnastica TaxID=73025 RepID=A0A6T2DQY2_9EUGL